MYFYLYIIVDIFSRKITGFGVHERESSEHAANLITQACLEEEVKREQLLKRQLFPAKLRPLQIKGYTGFKKIFFANSQ